MGNSLYAPVIPIRPNLLMPGGGPLHPTVSKTFALPITRRLLWLGASIVALVASTALGGRLMDGTRVQPRLGVVAVCMWPDQPNPEGLPFCDPS